MGLGLGRWGWSLVWAGVGVGLGSELLSSTAVEPAPARPLHCRNTAVTLPLHCRYTAVTLPLHCRYTAVAFGAPARPVVSYSVRHWGELAQRYGAIGSHACSAVHLSVTSTKCKAGLFSCESNGKYYAMVSN